MPRASAGASRRARRVDPVSPRPEPPSEGSRALGAAGKYVGLGVELVIPILLGIWIGRWLDRRFGWTPWGTLGGGGLMIAAGLTGFFRTVLPALRGSKGGR